MIQHHDQKPGNGVNHAKVDLRWICKKVRGLFRLMDDPWCRGNDTRKPKGFDSVTEETAGRYLLNHVAGTTLLTDAGSGRFLPRLVCSSGRAGGYG